MNTPSQSGSAIIWVLIAVALFAAIGVAMMSNSRTSTSMITDEQAKAEAAAEQSYDNAVNSAVKRLKLRGCTDSQISYETPLGNNENPDAPANESCHVFRIAGGQVEYQGVDVPIPVVTITCGAMTQNDVCSGSTVASESSIASTGDCKVICEAQAGTTCCSWSMISQTCTMTDGSASYGGSNPIADNSHSADCS